MITIKLYDPKFLLDNKTFNLEYFNNKYSQTCVHRKPLGPWICGCCFQVGICSKAALCYKNWNWDSKMVVAIDRCSTFEFETLIPIYSQKVLKTGLETRFDFYSARLFNKCTLNHIYLLFINFFYLDFNKIFFCKHQRK